MVKKSKFLKNLLTTASVLAVTASAGSAFAQDVTTNKTIATIGVGGPAGTDKVFKNNDNLVYGKNTAVNTNNNLTLSIDVKGQAPGLFTAANDVIATSITDTTGGDKKVNFVVNTGSKLTLNPGSFTSLGNVTLGTGGAATLDIKAEGATLTGDINSNANLGIINVNAKKVLFEGAVGVGGKIATMAISNGNDATLAKTVVNNIDAVTIGDGSQLTIRADAHLTGVTIDSTAAAKGTLEFEGNSNVIVATIGNTFALDVVKVTGLGVVDLKTAIVYNAKTTILDDAGAEIKFSQDANTDIEGDFKTTKDGEGKLSFAGINTATVVGSIGESDKALETVALTGGKILHIQNDGAQLHAGTVTSDANDNIVALQGKDFVINANIGTAAQPMTGGIELRADNAGAAAATFTLNEGKSIFGDVDLSKVNAKNNILVLGQKTAITGDVDAANANNGTLSVKGDATITGKIGAGNPISHVEFNEANTLTVTTNKIVTNGAMVFNADGKLKLTENEDLVSTKDVTITTAVEGGVGSIYVDEAKLGKTVTMLAVGDIATNKSLKLLSVTGGANIVLSEAAAIEEVSIGTQKATLSLTNAGDYLVKKFTHANDTGTLEISERLTLKEGSSFSTSGNKLDTIHFTANKTLTIEDGVDLHAVNGITNTAVGNGTLTFEGTSTVDAAIGKKTTNMFGAINVQGKGIVTFVKDVNLNTAANGVLTIDDGSTAVLQGKVTATDITGGGANNGTVVFDNTSADLIGADAVTTKIGNAQILETVRISGNDIEFNEAAGNGVFRTQNLEFKSANKVTATFSELAVNSFAGTKITTSNENKEHNLVINKGVAIALDHTFGEIAEAGKQFGNITIGKNHDTEITFTHANSYASVQTETNGEVTLKVNALAGAATLRGFGSKTSELKLAQFNTNAKVLEDAYAATITVDANREVTFNGVVNTSKAFTAANNSIVNLSGDGAVLASDLTVAAGSATVNIDGSAEIKRNIGAAGARFTTIRFNANDANKVAKVFGNLHANNVELGKHTLKAESNFTVDGGFNAKDGAVMDLGSKNITLQNGASTFTGNTTMKMELLDDKTTGKITVTGVGTTLDLSGTKLAVEILDTQDLPKADETYTLFETTAGGGLTTLAAGNGTATANRQFVEYDLVHDAANNNLNLVRKNVAATKLKEAVANLNNAQLSADAVRYGSSENTGDALAYLNDMDKMTDAQLEDSLQRVTSTGAVHATEAVRALDESLNNTINNRMGALSNHPQPGVQLASGQGAGVSAGEGDHTMYGAWFSPFYNTTTQKKRSGNSGFKSDSYGATLGFDVQANADLTVGVAGSYAKTDIKHKDFKSGDKTKMDTFMFSVYGIQQLTNAWFLQGNAAFSSSKVKNTEKMVISTGTEIAKGKFDVTSYTAEMLAGYNYNLDNVVVTPLLGASFSRTNAGGYKETGTTNQNRSISRKASNRFEAILGLRAQMTTDIDGISVTPEIHGFVKHDLIAKNAKVSAKHSGLVNAVDRSAKAQKTTFNVGFGVNAVSGMYEYGAGYDLFAGDKTLGHQGTLKVRLNF